MTITQPSLSVGRLFSFDPIVRGRPTRRFYLAHLLLSIMLKFSESTNEAFGAVIAAVGLAAIYGGIGVCLLGEMDGLNVSVAGCLTTSAAAVPLSAAAKQRRAAYDEMCAQLSTRRG